MKALVITGSRADRNCMEPVHDALVEAGHESEFLEWPNPADLAFPEVVVLGGDRVEILHAALRCAERQIPICHIAGGDVTEGSADDRYRDAISALACVHCVTNYDAFGRVWDKLKHRGDDVQLTGSPALDRIFQMPRLGGAEVMNRLHLNLAYKTIVIAVHPNTMPSQDPLGEAKVIVEAIDRLPSVNVVALGANADPGGDAVDQAMWISFGDCFHKHLDPQLYYSLLEGAHMMVGNSSAGLYEAPIFGLPFVLVGDRQQGRRLPENVISRPVGVNAVLDGISTALAWGKLANVRNPYGDGHSAPRIVRCLEDNQWRWAKP